MEFEKDAKLLMKMLHETSYCCPDCEREKREKRNVCAVCGGKGWVDDILRGPENCLNCNKTDA